MVHPTQIKLSSSPTLTDSCIKNPFKFLIKSRLLGHGEAIFKVCCTREVSTTQWSTEGLATPVSKTDLTLYLLSDAVFINGLQ